MNAAEIIKKFEKIVIYVLLMLMALVIIGAIIWFAFFLVKDFMIVTHGNLMLDLSNHMMQIFGFMFSIIIGLEIFDTIKVYLEKHIFHAEMIILVAIIAVSRKIIILDMSHLSPIKIIAIAILIAALTGRYFIIKKSKKNELNS